MLHLRLVLFGDFLHLENYEDLTFGKSLLCRATFSYTYVVKQHPYLMAQELIRPSI